MSRNGSNLFELDPAHSPAESASSCAVTVTMSANNPEANASATVMVEAAATSSAEPTTPAAVSVPATPVQQFATIHVTDLPEDRQHQTLQLNRECL